MQLPLSPSKRLQLRTGKDEGYALGKPFSSPILEDWHLICQVVVVSAEISATWKDVGYARGLLRSRCDTYLSIKV